MLYIVREPRHRLKNMADIKFSCPRCGQNITCDELWGGYELQCPSCQTSLTVPAKPAAPAAAPTSGGIQPPTSPVRLSYAQTHNPAPAGAGAAAQRVIPIRNLAPPPPPKQNKLVKYGTIVAVLAVLGVAGWFGYPYARGLLNKGGTDAPAAKSTGEGRVGRIEALNSTLDSSDSSAASSGTPSGEARSSRRPRASSADGTTGTPSTPTPPAAEKQLPVVPPVYTLDAAALKIPESRVNGMISGTNFVAESARVDHVGTAQVLRFFQGQVGSPDREMLIYLHLKPGEKLGGQTLNISQEMKGAGVPQVAKRWKPNPRYAPSLKSYYTGYALKLELGQMADNVVPGKIFLALPDNEQTVIAGVFKATNNIPDSTMQAAPMIVPAATPPAAGAAPSQQQDYFRQRYGTKR